MIKITDLQGFEHFLAASSIQMVSEANTHLQGFRAKIVLFDGTVIKAAESAASIAIAVEGEK